MGSRLNNITVMVTAAGAPGAPGIIKSLRINGERDIKLIGTDMNKDAVGFFMVDKHYVAPPGDSPDFIKSILNICNKEQVDVVLPLSTNELMSFSRNVDKFKKEGIRVAVSRSEALEIANNKARLYEHLNNNGILVPKTINVNTVKEFESAIYKLGYPENPVCFKPQFSKGSRGFRIINENIDKLDLLMKYKPDSTITTLEETIKILSDAKKFPELIVMEYLPGREYSVDTLVRNGNAIITIPRYREVIKQGISFIGVVEKNTEVIDISNKSVKSIGLDYNIGIQIKYSADNEPSVLEINPRVQGTIVLCTAAGVNMPYFGVKLALGEEIPKCEPKWGLKMIRYWEEVYVLPSGEQFRLIPK